MSFVEQFSVVDDAISPQPWMQLRPVARESIEAVSKSYDPTGGTAKNELIQTVQTHWTNNSPTQQWVYGMVTVGGCMLAFQTKTRAYLKYDHGVEISEDGESIPMHEASRVGIGGDVGKGGILALNPAYSVFDVRVNATTAPLLPQTTGWFLVEPGQKLNARVEVRFKSDVWESTNIDGGDTHADARFIAGEVQIDLFAVPAVAKTLERVIPSIVGGAANIQHDEEIDLGLADTIVSINQPVDLEEGDVLLAIVANDAGVADAIKPIAEQNGLWTLAHTRGEGLFYIFDVHMKVYTHVVGDPEAEPDTYDFENGLASEMIGVIIPLRGTYGYDTGDGWAIASNLSRFRFFEEHRAPSIERDGQFLIALSYVRHDITQGDLSQSPPDGMTEVIDIPATTCTMSIAVLPDPPNPTLDRHFVPSENPLFDGHTIAASILIPGTQLF